MGREENEDVEKEGKEDGNIVEKENGKRRKGR